ncbi:hypothetical protein [Pedobacter sp. HMWF019]|uniref:capsular polysaccharide export protein, LipB/KpsS family n=1 Tax=Pedobacter sp. HMWF019 TaxID=2056856 RepID=UPI001E3D7437|nr:hypothetical protein [Pedobacter sp. HMWF019]
MNISRLIKENIHSDNLKWEEPDDFRSLTDFNWSPVLSDRYLIEFSVKEREKIAAALFKGISELFNTHKFDFLLSEPVALFTTHVLYYFCLKNGTQPKFFNPCYFPGYFYFTNSISDRMPYSLNESRKEKLSNEVLEKINSFGMGIIEDKSGPSYHFQFLGKNKPNYFNQRKGSAPPITNTTFKVKLIQVVRVLRAFGYNKLFPILSDFQVAGSLSEHVFYLKCLIASKRGYDKLPVEYEKGALLYPLHYEPEASLLYYGLPYFNQIDLIEVILRMLPKGHVLYMKEHPNQFGALKAKKWLDLRKKYGNVKFIYGRESGRKLMKNVNSIVTINSTAGLDAAIIGKRVFVLGEVFYKKFPGIQAVNALNDLGLYLKNLRSDQHNENHFDGIINGLADIVRQSYPGNPGPSFDLYSEENLKNILFAIDSEFV